MNGANALIHFKDMEPSERLRESLERRCEALADEFPELERLELTVTPDGDVHTASGHATGRKLTGLSTHAVAERPRQAADQVLEKLRHQLRRTHDKRIFAHRREAQKHRHDGP